MLRVTGIVGDVGELRYAARQIDRVFITAFDASKPRLRCVSEAGSDVAIELTRGSFLRDGAVIHDDGTRIVIVERIPEPALLVRVDPTLDRASTVEHVAHIAHAFGNQHVPIEIVDGEIRVPITTSEEIARETVERLALPGANIAVSLVKLGCQQPLSGPGGHSHHHE